MSRYFPFFVDISHWNVLLYGAGTIAARRLRGLADYGAQVTVIAPEVSAEVTALAERYASVRLEERRYRSGEIENVRLVLSCTNDRETDRAIAQECREKHIPVNIASDQTLCDFFFPALVETEDITIGVCSGGTNHHKVREVSAGLREQLKESKQ